MHAPLRAGHALGGTIEAWDWHGSMVKESPCKQRTSATWGGPTHRVIKHLMIKHLTSQPRSQEEA
eukprot:8170277-Alexandrium_andersonii.AAC.1